MHNSNWKNIFYQKNVFSSSVAGYEVCLQIYTNYEYQGSSSSLHLRLTFQKNKTLREICFKQSPETI